MAHQVQTQRSARESALAVLRSSFFDAYNEKPDAVRELVVATDTLREAGWRYADMKAWVQDAHHTVTEADFDAVMGILDDAASRSI